jgi:hypothetical protein
MGRQESFTLTNFRLIEWRLRREAVSQIFHFDGQLSVESDGSEKLKADIPASRTDSLFSKPPQSGMAENRNFKMH